MFTDKNMSKNNSSMIKRIFDEFSFDDACLLYYYFVNHVMPRENEFTYYMFVKQFVREEFDAAYQAGGDARKFVELTCEEGLEWYRGAMHEYTQYAIDQEGGPQQLLTDIIFELMTLNKEKAVKIRCEITKIFYEDLKIYLETLYNTYPVGSLSSTARYIANRNYRYKRLKELLVTLTSARSY